MIDLEKWMKLVGGWEFYIIKSCYFGKVLKCIEFGGTSRKRKCIEFKGTDGVPGNYF